MTADAERVEAVLQAYIGTCDLYVGDNGKLYV